MTTKPKQSTFHSAVGAIAFVTISSLTLCVCCVPLHQQITESEDSEIQGFIGPLVIDKNEFARIASRKHLIASDNRSNSTSIQMSNCHCLFRPKIVQNKLIVTHRYGGGASNRESTKLFWTGEFHQNSKDEYMVDLILHSDVIDMRRALITDEKIFTIEAIQRNDAKTVWINLVGYEQLIRYDY